MIFLKIVEQEIKGDFENGRVYVKNEGWIYIKSLWLLIPACSSCVVPQAWSWQDCKESALCITSHSAVTQVAMSC